MNESNKPNRNLNGTSDERHNKVSNDHNGSDPEQETLLEFPCDFPIKIMGLNTDEVRLAVHRAIEEHGECVTADSSLIADTNDSDAITEATITEQPSRTGKYVSLTVTMRFYSKQQLDQAYQRFIAIDNVSMVL